MIRALLLALSVAVVIAWFMNQKPMERCEIVGDHEYYTLGKCIPYCPPRPSQCG